jgi:hypothetical protein
MVPDATNRINALMNQRYCLVALLAAVLYACDNQANVESGSPSSDTVVSDASPDTSAADSTRPPADAPEPGPNLLTADGWGTLRIGMSRAEVVAAAGEDANPNAVGGAEPDQCDQFRPRSAPDGLLVMIERGVLTRITMSRNPAVKTPEGFGVGDSAAAIIAAYGSRARVDLHKYSDAPAKYITVWQGSPTQKDRRGIRYEIDTTDKVAHVHAGSQSIEYVEGCS